MCRSLRLTAGAVATPDQVRGLSCELVTQLLAGMNDQPRA